jgi:hypothetical protein
MSKKPPNKTCHFIFVDVHADQTVSRVTQVAAVKAKVKRKERRMPQAMQQWDDFFVPQSFPAHIVADVMHRNMPSV